MSLNRRIFKDSVIVSLLGMLAQVVGLMIPMLVAMKFGANWMADAYYLAVAIPILIISMVVGGSLRLVFIPVYIEEKNRDPEAGGSLIGSVSMMLTLLSFALMVVVGVAAWAGMFNSSADAKVGELATLLTYELLPLIPLRILFNLYMAVYQSYQRFAIAEFARVAVFLVEAVMIILLADSIGIHSIVVGQLVGHLLAMGLLLWVIRFRLKLRIRYGRTLPPGVKRMLKLSAVAFAAYAVAQMNPFMSRMIASLLEAGSVTILSFAQRISQIPGYIIGSSIGTVLTSHWAQKLVENNPSEVKSSFNRVMSMMFLVVVPLAAGLYLLRQPLVDLLFLRGDFTVEDAHILAMVVGILAIQIVPRYLYNVIARILHVEKRMTELFWLSLLGVAIAVVAMFIFSRTLGLGIAGVAYGIVLGAFIGTTAAAALVHRYYGLFEFSTLARGGWRVLLATGVMWFAVKGALYWTLSPQPFFKFGQLLLISFAGAVAYGIVLKVLRHPEMKALLRLVAQRIRPRAKASRGQA